MLLALTAVAFLGSMVIGRQPLARRVFEGVFKEPLDISAAHLARHQCPVGGLVRAARGGEYLCRTQLCRERVGELQGVRHRCRDVAVHDPPGVLAQQQDQAPPIGRRSAVSVAEREQRLRRQLIARFAPVELAVEDESHRHAGHAGAAGGASHFRIRIVAEAFRGIPPVARHRLIYAALGDMLKSEIHALAIEALPPAD